MNILDYSDLITFLISTGSVVGVCVCVWCGGIGLGAASMMVRPAFGNLKMYHNNDSTKITAFLSHTHTHASTTS